MAGMRYQPQGRAKLNTSGLGRGVKMLLLPVGGALVDVVNNKKWATLGTANIDSTPHGRAAVVNGTNGTRFAATGYENIVGNVGTFFIWMPRVGAQDLYGQVLLSAGTWHCQIGVGNEAIVFNAPITNAGTSTIANSRNRALVFASNGVAAGKRFYNNGVSVGTPSATAVAALPSGSKTFLLGGYSGGEDWNSDVDIVLAGFTSEVWTSAQAKQFYENPWQLFEEDDDDEGIFYPPDTSTSSYSYIPSGGVEFTGVASALRSSFRESSLGMFLAGAANITNGVGNKQAIVLPVGGMTITGAGSFNKGVNRAATAFIGLGGQALISRVTEGATEVFGSFRDVLVAKLKIKELFAAFDENEYWRGLLGGSDKPLNDVKKQVLRDAGKTGALNDMEKDYWENL